MFNVLRLIGGWKVSYHCDWAQELSSELRSAEEDNVADDCDDDCLGHMSMHDAAYDGGGGIDVAASPSVVGDVDRKLPLMLGDASSSWTVVEWMPTPWKKFLMLRATDI